MADWDVDSPQLRQNLIEVLRRILGDARARAFPTVELARRWHFDMMQGLEVPAPSFQGNFRGEPGLENIEVRIGRRRGVPAAEVAGELARLERTVQQAVGRLDELIPPDAEPDADGLVGIISVCAWAHAEWVRIHPFANGNGRTARLWANSIAMRYGLPPFIRLRPRPDNDYGLAAEAAMSGNWRPTVAVFTRLLDEFLGSGNDA
jgi:hypothetical protein